MYRNYLKSTIGRKQVVGVMGLALSLFVFVHMLGNMFLFVSPEAYNKYGHALMSNPLIYFLEAGLVFVFIAHLVLALRLAWQNHKARPEKYKVQSHGEKKTTFVQKTMWHQGVIVLVFIVLHLITFKYGEVYFITYDGIEMRDLFRLIKEVFQSPVYVGWYVLSLTVLMFHLGHGFSSALKTLGLNRPNHIVLADKLGRAYAVLVGLGFIVQPVYIFFYY